MVILSDKIVDILNIDLYTTEGLEIKNCIINKLQLTGCSFSESVKIINCNIKSFNAVGTWFEAGLEIKNNIFINEVSFEAGGHNAINYAVSIEHNVFNCFVDFFDAHYIGLFIFNNNIVLKGCNLVANSDEPYHTIFETGSKINNNIGALNIENPGD